MSFLVDPPLLVANGIAIGRLVPGEGSTRAAEAAVLGTFLGTSIALYLDREWTRPLWEACGAATGRDWMLNSGVFSFDFRRPSRTTHVVAAALFATYPLWLRWGVRLGRRRRSRRVA